MIKANELRIGNLVYCNDIIVDIATVSNTGEELNIAYYDSVGLYDYTDIRLLKPIPITEEWLIKFDYVLLTDVGYYHRVKGTNKMDSSIYINDGKFYSDSLYEKEIKYVHTLQNYYYFNKLTGEELTMK